MKAPSSSSAASAASLLLIGFVQCTGNDGGGHLIPAPPAPTDTTAPAAADDGSSVAGEAPPIAAVSAHGSGPERGADAGQADAGAADRDGSPTSCPYATTTTCGTSPAAGAVRGDTGSDVLELTGTTSAWFRFAVTEADLSVLPTSLSFTATLQSPPGMNFDLRVYTAPCDGPLYGRSVEDAGALDTVKGSWGDLLLVDDSRTVIVEVRYVSGGLCGQDASWTLRLLGNAS